MIDNSVPAAGKTNMDMFTLLNLVTLATIVGILFMLLTHALTRYAVVHQILVRINLTRYSWLTGLLLVGLVPAAIVGAPTLLWNLFIIDGADFFWVSLMAALTAATAILTARITMHNAAERYDDVLGQSQNAPRLPGWTWSIWLLFLSLTAPVPVFALVASCLDRNADLLSAAAFRDMAWVGAGLIAALVWLLGHAGLHWVLLNEDSVAEGLLPFEQFFVRYRTRSFQRVDRLTGKLASGLQRLGPGYVRNGQPRPGHVQGLLFGGLGLLAYVLVYNVCILRGPVGGVWVPFPALALTLLVILLVGYALTAIAFALDYYRVPPLLAIALVSAALYWVCDTDHYFQLHPDRHTVASWTQVGISALALALGLLLIRGMLRQWRIGMAAVVAGLAILGIAYFTIFSSPRHLTTFDRKNAAPVVSRADVPRFAGLARVWSIPKDRSGHKTLVIFAASGGGIQASAWTAKVLTGLHERYGADFVDSVKLISSVSGGSLGTATYLRGLRGHMGGMRTEEFAAINRIARAPTLDAGVWGIAFPDLLRMAFPPLAPQMKDRGWALEGAWRESFRHLNAGEWNNDDGEWRLSHLMEATKTGRFPVVVFNSVQAESGRRLQISPVLLASGSTSAEEALAPSPFALEFWHLFDPCQADPRVATAVRLSASFPYVSPMSRADLRLDVDQGNAGPPQTEADRERRLLQQGHMVDGGYVDNEGLLTAVEWLRTIMPLSEGTSSDKPFDRVLIIRIIPFAPEQKIQQQEAAKSFRSKWSHQTKAETDREVENITTLNRTGWINEIAGPINALLALRGTSQMERNSLVLDLFSRQYLPPDRDHEPGAKVYFVQFVFDPDDHSVTPPLSWKLGLRQDQLIDSAWAGIEQLASDKNSPLSVIETYFRPLPTAKALAGAKTNQSP